MKFSKRELYKLNELFLSKQLPMYVEKVIQKIEKVHKIKLHSFREENQDYLGKVDVVAEKLYEGIIKNLNNSHNALVSEIEKHLKTKHFL